MKPAEGMAKLRYSRRDVGAMSVPVFIINLDRSPERLTKISQRLAILGVNFSRVQAIDGLELPIDDLARYQAKDIAWSPLKAGEIGCFLSHRKCWEMIERSPYNFGCVMEDDAVISDRFPEAIISARNLPDYVDVLKLDTTFKRVWLDRGSIAVHSIHASRLRSGHYGAGAYIVSKNAAKVLLAKSKTFAIGVDVFLFDPLIGAAHDLRVYQCAPAVCGHDYFIYPGKETDTTIGVERHYSIDNKLSWRLKKWSDEIRKVSHLAMGRKRVSIPLA